MKLFAAPFLLAICPLVVHGADTQKLTMYECDNHLAAESCGGFCTKVADNLNLESYQVDFLINKNSNAVMIRTYIGKSEPTGTVHKNCTIFDDKNWDCSDEPVWTGKWYVYSTYKMVGGTYISQLYTVPDRMEAKVKGNYCAK